MQGPDPQFNSKKLFKIKMTQSFKSYLDKHVLSIDFIDEGVDISKVGSKDYIGSVRIPLREASNKGSLEGSYPVMDGS